MRQWAMAALVRALKTAAQSAIALIGTAVVIADVSWEVVLSGSLLSALLSILTSLAGIPEADGGASVAEIMDKENEETHG